MIKMGKRKKTKADEVRRKSGRRKHIREKREAPVGPCTKKNECISPDTKMNEN